MEDVWLGLSVEYAQNQTWSHVMHAHALCMYAAAPM